MGNPQFSLILDMDLLSLQSLYLHPTSYGIDGLKDSSLSMLHADADMQVNMVISIEGEHRAQRSTGYFPGLVRG